MPAAGYKRGADGHFPKSPKTSHLRKIVSTRCSQSQLVGEMFTAEARRSRRTMWRRIVYYKRITQPNDAKATGRDENAPMKPPARTAMIPGAPRRTVVLHDRRRRNEATEIYMCGASDRLAQC